MFSKIIIFTLFFSTKLWATPSCPNPSICENSLVSLSQFDQYAAAVSGKKVVKFVYLRNSQGSNQIYFFNTKKHSYHIDFVREELGIHVGNAEFNRNYSIPGKNRKFNMGSLVFYPNINNQDLFVFNLWSGDNLEIDYLRELYTTVRNAIKVDLPFAYNPLSVQQELAASQSMDSIPIIKTEDLYLNKKFQALTSGTSYGYLKLVDESNSEVCLDHTSIALFKKVPNEIGLVGGIITENFQTPLGHVNVKSQNRGTINMALKGATSKLEKYIGRAVKISVTGTEYKIELIDENRADQKIREFWEKKRPQGVVELNSITTNTNEFVEFENALNYSFFRNNHKYLIQTIGAKSANLAVLAHLQKKGQFKSVNVKTPNGYAIPFSFYDQFMNFAQTGLDHANPERVTTPKKIITKLLKEAGLLENGLISPCKSKQTLAKIRSIIENSVVPPSVLSLFKNILIEDKNSPIHISKVEKIRLRSSTNAEDLEGFNGAGLYNSTGISLYKKLSDGSYNSAAQKSWKKIAAKIKRKLPYIYSSVWNDRAFDERVWFNMGGTRHFDVKVGVAVHRSFPSKSFDGSKGELANGVGITTDIYSPEDFWRTYLNSQHFDLAVTNPPTEEELIKYNIDPNHSYLTEEVMVEGLVDYGQSPELVWKDWSYQYLTRSSIQEGQSVFLDNPEEFENPKELEIRRLTRALAIAEEFFAKLYKKANNPKFAIDAEYKVFGEDRSIWIKQARPFKAK
ncbi:MAG: hypothetical protein HOE90_23735 [Bacteriovoracaceae bacterium]|jgi:pyruvate, water dikinase|nr:hypothetical protein [Bacteriovoracaceae bacterium]